MPYNPLLPKFLNNPNVDMIAQEDPNASIGPYPAQVDYYGNPIQEQVAQTQKLLNRFNELKSKPKMPAANPFEDSYAKEDAEASMDITEPTKEEPKTIQAAVQANEPQQPFKYSQDALEQILRGRNDSSLSNGLLRAGMMANQGLARMSGADVKPDEGALQALSKQGDIPLENFSTGLKASTETELVDPNSDISKFARDRVKKELQGTGINLDVTKMSASQLIKMGLFKPDKSGKGYDFSQSDLIAPDGTPLIFERTTGQYLDAYTKQPYKGQKGPAQRKVGQTFVDSRTGERFRNNLDGTKTWLTGPEGGKSEELSSKDKQLISANDGQMVTSKEAPKTAYEIKNTLDSKTFDTVENAKKEFIKETEEARKVIAGLDGTKQMLDLAEKNPAGKPIAAAAITRLFEKGVLTDKDVERYVIRQGIFNSAEDYASALSSGTFSKAQVIQLAQALDSYKKQQEEQVQNIAAQKADNISGYINPNLKINSKDLSNMIYTQSNGQVKQSKFPMQVRKGNTTATVSNEQELAEANKEGFQ